MKPHAVVFNNPSSLSRAWLGDIFTLNVSTDPCVRIYGFKNMQGLLRPWRCKPKDLITHKASTDPDSLIDFFTPTLNSPQTEGKNSYRFT
jgi:hypothetical protein